MSTITKDTSVIVAEAFLPAWPTVLLDDVASRGSGHTPTKKRPEYWGGDIKWVSLKDSSRLDDGIISSTSASITKAGLNNSSAVVHAGGSVILLRDAGIGKSAVLGEDMAVSQHFMAWKCSSRLYNWFLYYVLQYRKSEFERISNGSTIKTIGLDFFRQMTVPLPAYAEQVLIGDALRNADDLISKLESLIAKKQAIKQGMMQQLLTGKTRLPGFTGSWTKHRFGSIGIFLKGRGIRRDDVRESGIPCLRYGELYTAFNDYTPVTKSFVSTDTAAAALPLRTGDLLFAGSGETRDEIGKCVAYIGSTPAVAGGDIVVLRGDGFNPVYLGLLANTSVVVEQKSRAGQGDAVVHISSRALADIEVELPPRDEQDVIAEAVVDADREISSLRVYLAKANSVRQGMMQELLTGRRRLQSVEMKS